ncbi:helix-turn-helix domain-containing protein [Sulfoacidibacillus thermotolerans]|uniref:Helix-turn-helix conjugative transposon-like domain-containing protein n=1 Tax=Sulfoacidibacillus thermotolerans TaxID=1765684 RepID=A0A2U3CMM9_SULT2|nr:helix-turn-helix domain-containing protein [Sulfoacidibacillus thermotolerans]PWI50269.1 hypothetical protein BM613_14535 [Sulfoacidibacillus thermotolerans]
MSETLVELFERAKADDKVAFGEIILRFEPLIRSVSRVNGVLNEDVAQEVREEFLQKIYERVGQK